MATIGEMRAAWQAYRADPAADTGPESAAGRLLARAGEYSLGWLAASFWRDAWADKPELRSYDPRAGRLPAYVAGWDDCMAQQAEIAAGIDASRAE